ncbi:DUF2986 domain-containing protein [Endozoicomonas arenosclerae]|uniref:DUF2986 domain-containing protein n=1 Tax=Endozoicomonas arenosclerae TaxID=1633495 RepID=UPI0009A1BC82|nr:DUF2986 domain-containing protein [Endozoicomonas arenosclerae]
MNRRKKGNQILKAKAKRAKSKLAPKSNKPKYISKAERARLESEEASQESPQDTEGS